MSDKLLPAKYFRPGSVTKCAKYLKNHSFTLVEASILQNLTNDNAYFICCVLDTLVKKSWTWLSRLWKSDLPSWVLSIAAKSAEVDRVIWISQVWWLDRIVCDDILADKILKYGCDWAKIEKYWWNSWSCMTVKPMWLILHDDDLIPIKKWEVKPEPIWSPVM